MAIIMVTPACISRFYLLFGVFAMQEARALLGRIEYQKGNIEAALHVFEGIDIAAIIPKMKLSLTRKVERRKRQSHDSAPPPMSVHAVSLLLEAIFLKAQSLQHLQRSRGNGNDLCIFCTDLTSALFVLFYICDHSCRSCSNL